MFSRNKLFLFNLVIHTENEFYATLPAYVLSRKNLGIEETVSDTEWIVCVS